MCRKHAQLGEANRMRVVEALAAFVTNVADGVRALERGAEPEEVAQYRSAFKLSVYFLIMALTALSHELLQQEKDIVAKVRRRREREWEDNRETDGSARSWLHERRRRRRRRLLTA